MRLIFTHFLFLTCLLTAKAQIRFEDSYLYATGRYVFSLSGRNNSLFQQNSSSPVYTPPYKKIAYQNWANDGWRTNAQNRYNFLNDNCSQLQSVNYMLANRESIRDSLVIANGVRTDYMLYEVNTSGELIERSHEKYFYNNRAKLDSIYILDNSPNKTVVTYVYDSQYRQTASETIGVSATTRTINGRSTCEYDENGELAYFKEEYYIDSRWRNNQEWFIKWSSGKLLTFKMLDYYNTSTDTQRLTFNYLGTTNTIKDIVDEKYQPLTQRWDAQRRYVNVSQNIKGYPTQIDYQSSPNNGLDWGTFNRLLFKYYPNDTLLLERTTINMIPNPPVNLEKEIYEYCGVALLSPVHEMENLDFTVFPNPTNQVLNIRISPYTEGGVSVEIFNALGSVVLKTNDLEVDISEWPAGLYFVQVKHQKKAGLLRFSVTK
jgi:Secretion system C-terminal sorting domain